MSVNLYGNIGTTYTGIVTGAELEKVSQEIFGGAKVQAQTAQPANTQPAQTSQTPANELNLYNRKVDISLTQQIAQAKVDLNVQLSPQALQNIATLKTLAATQQTNVHKLSEGKVYIPVDNSEKSDVSTPRAVPHSTNVLNAFSMEADRKGSNPFSYTKMSSQNNEESAEGSNGTTNIVA